MSDGSRGRNPTSGQSSTATPQNKRKHSPIRYPHSNHSLYYTTKKQRFHSKSLSFSLNSSAIQTHRYSYVDNHHTYKSQKHRKRDGRRSADSEGHRKWVYASRDSSSYRDKVVFVSYNILGVENASNHQDLYSNIPLNFLDWKNRKHLIHKEVDRFDDLEKLLRRDGFQGVYQARTGEAGDGCAMFWKNEIFSLLHQENIKFESFGLRNNVAQLCILKMSQNKSNDSADKEISMSLPSRTLVVGNIHVLFNPSRGDIKLGQVRLFLEKAHKLSQEWGKIPVIIAGDFNSVPQSALYKFLASSELDIQLHDRRKISGQICSSNFPASQFQSRNAARWSDEELRLAAGTEQATYLMHNLKLSSAYAGLHGSLRTRDNLGEPLATSYHSKFMGTVDYIWHTEELVCTRVLETLPVNVLRKTGGLPSKKWGSDHLALVCELAFADDSDNGS